MQLHPNPDHIFLLDPDLDPSLTIPLMIFNLNVFWCILFHCFVIFKWEQFLATINRTNRVRIIFQRCKHKDVRFSIQWFQRIKQVYQFFHLWIYEYKCFIEKNINFLICCLHLKHPMFKITKICPKSKGFILETCCCVGNCCVGCCSTWTTGFCAVVA